MSTTPGMAPKGILHEQASNHGTHDMALEPTAGQGPYLRVRPRISAVNQGLRA